MRLSIVRIESARERRGLPLSQAPFSNGLIWMIDLSIALGSGKILAILALDAHHHHLVNGAPSLHHVHCLAVSVADSWTGEALAEMLKRLIAQMGRPTASLKDGGSELQKAADLLELQGLASTCIDDISHAAANMLKHSYQHHPAFERSLSACGRASTSSSASEPMPKACYSARRFSRSRDSPTSPWPSVSLLSARYPRPWC